MDNSGYAARSGRNSTKHVSGSSFYFQRSTEYAMTSETTYERRTRGRQLPTLEEYLAANPGAKIPKAKTCPDPILLRKACQEHGCAWIDTLDVLRNPKCSNCPIRKKMIEDSPK